MALPKKTGPCAGCKSTVEVISERLDLHRKDIQSLAAQLAALELKQTGKVGRVQLPSGYNITKTPEDSQAKFFDEPEKGTPEQAELVPIEAATGFPRKR